MNRVCHAGTVVFGRNQWVLMIILLLIGLGITTDTRAEIVQAVYSISASDFENSNGEPPDPPTSNFVEGICTFTFDTSQAAQNEIVPDEVQGLDIVRSTGVLNDFDATNTGVNTSLNASTNTGQITIGGTVSSVAFMVGLSNDFRIAFDISLSNYEVTAIAENFKFVTRNDPFYTALVTTVELVEVNVLVDTDGDGIFDNSDNCTLVENAAQRDTDADGIGNFCDPDFSQNCIVNFDDLATMQANFFLPGDLDTDLDGSGMTSFSDLAIIADYFFGPPGPSGLPNPCP